MDRPEVGRGCDRGQRVGEVSAHVGVCVCVCVTQGLEVTAGERAGSPSAPLHCPRRPRLSILHGSRHWRLRYPQKAPSRDLVSVPSLITVCYPGKALLGAQVLIPSLLGGRAAERQIPPPPHTCSWYL